MGIAGFRKVRQDFGVRREYRRLESCPFIRHRLVWIVAKFNSRSSNRYKGRSECQRDTLLVKDHQAALKPNLRTGVETGLAQRPRQRFKLCARLAGVGIRNGDSALSSVQATDNHRDRKSTRLNSSHLGISYAVFCLKKKKKEKSQH